MSHEHASNTAAHVTGPVLGGIASFAIEDAYTLAGKVLVGVLVTLICSLIQWAVLRLRARLLTPKGPTP